MPFSIFILGLQGLIELKGMPHSARQRCCAVPAAAPEAAAPAVRSRRSGAARRARKPCCAGPCEEGPRPASSSPAAWPAAWPEESELLSELSEVQGSDDSLPDDHLTWTYYQHMPLVVPSGSGEEEFVKFHENYWQWRKVQQENPALVELSKLTHELCVEHEELLNEKPDM